MRPGPTIAALALAAAATAQTPALDAAAAAMGGKERVLGVRTLVLEGAGTNLNFGQNYTPAAETRFDVTSYKRSYDFVNRRWLLDQARVPAFTTANMSPQRQRQGMDGAAGGIAFNVSPTDVMQRVGGAAASDRAHEFLYHPVGFLISAYQPGAAVTEEAGPGNTRVVVLSAGDQRFRMVVDGRSGLPIRIERPTYQAMLGDVMLINEFADWAESGGVRLPMRITQRYENLFTLSAYQLTGSAVNADVGNIGASDSIRALPPPGPQAVPAPPTIVVDSLAPGVWLIAGQTHHTVAIEQQNQLVLVEAPQSEARTLAAIEAARGLRPGKAPTVVINTHHHFDHAGGFRAAVSQGLSVVTQRGNRDFYERIVFPRKHTMNRDELARNPKPLRLTAVGDRHVMRDSMRTIEIHHVPNPHNGAMLVVYLPMERMLVQADLYNPPANPPAAGAPAPVFPFVASLVDAVQKAGLQVDRVVGIHGRPVAYSELQSAAAANRAP